jgi:hypothetical protein
MHAANEIIEYTPKRVYLFSLGAGGRLWMVFFNSCVPILFPICSHMFPIMFLKFSMFLRVFPIATQFITYHLPKGSLLLTYVDEPNGRHPILTSYYFGEPPSFKFLLFFDDGPIKMDH